ncbi:lysylphosphatidylglycerol synthase domain-containing protein [Streptomyces sp. AK02-04a]|nr:lysylphosphatidylglycerol synthase domain-containing protein [Streptomyces sp. AK02-04a]MDX3762989.1 lysylphosphatidylglycerol synthase domain-containing protein [Streptomyces sp. AK02-04a]
MQVVAVIAPVLALGVLVARRRGDAILRVVPAAALGALVAWSVTHLALIRGRPDLWPQVLAGRGGLVHAGWPSAVYLAACAAAVVAAGPWLDTRLRRTWWTLTVVCAGLSVAAAAVVPLEAAAALAVGGVAGSAVLLVAGGPADRPAPQAVADALVACGIPLAALRETPSPDRRPGEGVRYGAETTTGARLAVQVLGPEDRNRDLFHRLARLTMLRHPADTAAFSPLAAVEHELLMLVFAGRTGARVAEPVIAYPVAGGGALLVTVERAARPLSPFPGEEMTDQVLTGVWTSVARLQEHRLAHRALLPEHILVEPDGTSRLTAFARAQLDARPDALGSDIAELLATTATHVGAHRATQCALAGLGPRLLATALPYLQPLALLGPARREVARYDQARARAAGTGAKRRTVRPGGRPSLLRDLSAEVVGATGAEPAPLAHLARFTWKSVFGLVGAFLILHLVLPQFANASAVLTALRDANWWWVLAVLPVTLISQAFSTCLQMGTIPARLPFGPTYEVQFASSFLNRITPSNVGGMALNLRYLQKTGIETGAATASVGLQSLAGAVSNAVVAAGSRPVRAAGRRPDPRGRVSARCHPTRPALPAREGVAVPARGDVDRDRDRVRPRQADPPRRRRARSAPHPDRRTRAERARVRRRSSLRPGWRRLHGGTPRSQRNSGLRRTGRPRSRPHRRSDRARLGGRRSHLGGPRLPAAHVLAERAAGRPGPGLRAAQGLRLTPLPFGHSGLLADLEGGQPRTMR